MPISYPKLWASCKRKTDGNEVVALINVRQAVCLIYGLFISLNLSSTANTTTYRWPRYKEEKHGHGHTRNSGLAVDRYFIVICKCTSSKSYNKIATKLTRLQIWHHQPPKHSCCTRKSSNSKRESWTLASVFPTKNHQPWMIVNTDRGNKKDDIPLRQEYICLGEWCE